MTRTVNVVFNDEDFKQLQQMKGERSWHDAILEEFGVEADDHGED